jgi:hypothetical protein
VSVLLLVGLGSGMSGHSHQAFFVCEVVQAALEELLEEPFEILPVGFPPMRGDPIKQLEQGPVVFVDPGIRATEG